MQQHIHTIVKHFFQKDSLQEVPENVLEKFAEEHPYSSVGHWLLARKVHDTAADRFPAQASRAVTWFNNPLWLEWTLGDHEPIRKALIVTATTVKDAVVAKEAVAAPVVEIPVFAEEAEEPESAQPDAWTPAVDVAPEEEAAPAIAAVTETAEDITETPEEEAPALIATTYTVSQPDTEEEETEIMIPGVSEPVSLIEPPVQAAAPAIETPFTFDVAAQEEEEEVIGVWEEEETEQPASVEEVAFSPVAEASIAPVSEEVNVISAIGSRLAQEIAASNIKNISETEEPIFEPYHTIDYFGSLGIKLRQEDMRDKLGIQLRSFTDWLRSMKRIAPVAADASTQLDEQQQESIVKTAGYSNEAREVITEAMADVWAKQGHPDKAIAIFEKLSLLNPAKSAYFATRIDQLKA